MEWLGLNGLLPADRGELEPERVVRRYLALSKC